MIPVTDPRACECVKVQQDDSCPVGYPSLLCEECSGTGYLKATKRISDVELLRRAVTNARDRNSRGKHVRWAAVMWSFGVGSTTAHELCVRFGLDPDERVK